MNNDKKQMLNCIIMADLIKLVVWREKMNIVKLNSKFEYTLNLMVSLMLAAAPKYIQMGYCKFNLGYFLTVLWIFMALTVISWGLRSKLLNNSINKDAFFDSNKWIKIIFNSKYSVLYITLIIFSCWLPVIISLYPGTLINDTWGQLGEFINFSKGGVIHKGVLSDHHPFVDTLIMGSIITPFGKLFHNWQLGIFVYVIIQAFFSALSFSLTVKYAHAKLMLKNTFLVFMVAFYALCPVFPASVQTVSKDALFSWIYVIFIILYIEAIRTKCQCFNNIKYDIWMIVVASLSILTKKVGLYVILFSLLALIFLIPKNRIKSFGVLIVTLFISVGLSGMIKSNLKVVPGGKQEMFSLPFQQTARYYKYYKNEVTKKEYRTLNEVVDMKNIDKRYNPTLADPVKGYNDRGSTQQYINYLKVWFAEGIKHPRVYFDAGVAMLSGWFSFSEYNPLMEMSWHSQLNPSLIPSTVPDRRGFFKYSSDTTQQFFNDLYSNPLFTIFLSYAFYATLIPVFVISTLCKKWYSTELKYYWLAMVPLILSLVLGCWLSPVSIVFEGRRYLYPVVYTLPIMVALCVSMYQKKSVNTFKRDDG
ncbi:DUF6020 family protein [Liquorilactobacillus hordei]|uniref:DUF6020 family protein n=1 Tax=Liquorilactobacillus hordei TaxID=468911 RepID=UPI0039E7C477